MAGTVSGEGVKKSMLYEERAEIILKQVQLKNIVTVNELKGLLNVSVDTVRRDLRQMEAEGQIKCVRGGACLPDALAVCANFRRREIINILQKQTAARRAVREIREGAVIAMNAGTTNTILAQELAAGGAAVTVVTNNLAAANILMHAPSLRLILIGGLVDPMEQSTFGTDCEAAFGSYIPDIAFLSINAVSLASGFTDFRYHETGIIRILAERSLKTLAVMDSSKLETTSKKQVLALTEVDGLVTDGELSGELREEYRKKGLNIL